MINHDNRFMNKTERKAAWGLFHTASLVGGSALGFAGSYNLRQSELKAVQEKITEVTTQHAASQNGTLFIISENTYDIEKLGKSKILTQAETNALSTTTPTELLKPLHKKQQALQDNVIGYPDIFGLGATIALAYIMNTVSLQLGSGKMYERGGVALAKILPKKKPKATI